MTLIKCLAFTQVKFVFWLTSHFPIYANITILRKKMFKLLWCVIANFYVLAFIDNSEKINCVVKSQNDTIGGYFPRHGMIS